MSIDRRRDSAGRFRYRVRLYSGDKYVGGRTFSAKRDAVEWEREQKRRIERGTYVDPKEGQQLVEVWAKKWMESTTVGPRTRTRNESLLRLHVLPIFGRRPLVLVRRSEVQEMVRDLAASHSPSTARLALGVLRQIYKMAELDGVIDVNPCRGIKLPPSRPGERQPLTSEQVWTLIDVAENQQDRVIIAVLAYTGLRWGELAALRVSDYRPADRRILIERAYTDDRGALSLGPVKDHAVRTVVLPSAVAEMLDRWLSRRYHESADTLIFMSSAGTPLRNRNWTQRSLAPITHAVGRQVTPHHFRDTAASLAIAAGASVMTVARMLGHEDPSVTLRHYAREFPSEVAGVAAALNAGIVRGREVAQETQKSAGDAGDRPDHGQTIDGAD